MLARLKTSLLLAPAILLLLIWIGRFSGAEEIAKMGLMSLLLWGILTSVAISYCVTLFLSSMLSSVEQK